MATGTAMHGSGSRLLTAAGRHAAQVQEASPAEHIRNLWRLHHEHHSYSEFQEEWATCLLLIACPGAAPRPKCTGTSSATSADSAQTAGPR
jgi:hypothetical protein